MRRRFMNDIEKPAKVNIYLGTKKYTRAYKGMNSYFVNLHENPVQSIVCKYTDTNISYTYNKKDIFTPYRYTIIPSGSSTLVLESTTKTLLVGNPTPVMQLKFGSSEFVPEMVTTLNKQ